MRISAVVVVLVAGAVAVPASSSHSAGPVAPAPRVVERFAAGHSREGLPISGTPVPTYARDADHWLNELHALLFTQSLVPEEVAAVLPTERTNRADADFFVKGWQFGKRKGTELDRTTFGGDVRVSAVVTVDAKRRERLVLLLDRLSSADRVAAVPELKEPLARLMLQWDVLSLWWRLESDRKWKHDDPELLTAMAKAVRALAQPKQVLEGLPSGATELIKQFADRTEAKSPSEPFLPPTLFDQSPKSGWVEIERKSTRLFRGDTALRTSRVFLDAGTRTRSVELIEAANAKAARPEVPTGTQVGLVLTLVGFDESLIPVATPVVDEVRVRRVTGPFRLGADNSTSSHDGIDHWVYFRSRSGSLLGGQPFRFIPDTTQGLFLEYGSAKHTTFAAQCALCHRAEINTLSAPMGISSLNPAARPRVLDKPDTRFRLAEEEMKSVAERLRLRLDPKSK